MGASIGVGGVSFRAGSYRGILDQTLKSDPNFGSPFMYSLGQAALPLYPLKALRVQRYLRTDPKPPKRMIYTRQVLGTISRVTSPQVRSY